MNFSPDCAGGNAELVPELVSEWHSPAPPATLSRRLTPKMNRRFLFASISARQPVSGHVRTAELPYPLPSNGSYFPRQYY
jgi:hypothetical protein